MSRSDGAGKFSNSDSFANRFQAFQRSGELVEHQRELQTHCRRLGMDAVTATDHRDELRFARATFNRFAQVLNVRNQDVRGLNHLHSERSVEYVAAGQAEMQPATRRRADVFRDVGGKSDDVVIERALQFFAPLDVERGLGPHLREVLLRHDTGGDEGFGREQFNLQPDLELALLGPDFAHGWT